jgi:hypothetical protein
VADDNNVSFDVTTTPTEDEQKVTTSNVTITADTAQNLTGKTVTVNTDVATVTLDTKVVDDVAKASESDGTKTNVTLTVENTTDKNKGNTGDSNGSDSSDNNTKLVSSVEVKLTDENGESVATELSGEITVAMDANGKEDGETVYLYRIVDGKPVEPVEATVVNGKIVFTTSMMGEYALYETPVDEAELSDNSAGEHKDVKDGGDGVCDDCGQVIGAYLYSHTLTLDGDIGVNYYMYLTNDVAAYRDSYMEFKVDGRTIKVTIDDAKPSGSYYVFTCPVYATEMADEITATFVLVKNSGTTQVRSTKDYSYSVAQYAENVRAKYKAGDSRYTKKLMDVIDAMLYYGGASQTYMNHHTDNIASKNVDVEQFKADVTAYDWDTDELTKNADGALVLSSIEGIARKVAVLVMDTETKVRVYFKLEEGYSIGDYTVSVNGNAAEFKAGTGDYAGWYYLETSGIAAADLRTRQSILVSDTDGGYLVIMYGPMSYVYSKLSSTSAGEALKEMCSALYYYYKAAAAYNGAK